MPATPLWTESEQDSFLLELYAMLQRVAPRGRNDGDREDLIHDVTLRFLTGLRNGRRHCVPDNLEAFARTLIHNERVNSSRTRKRRDSYDAEHLRDLEGSHKEWMHPDRSGDEASLQAGQQRALSGLPARCQRAYYLVRNEGLTYKEAGKVLGVSPNTIHNYLSAAHRALRGWFEATGRTAPHSGRGGRPRGVGRKWRTGRLVPRYPVRTPPGERRRAPEAAETPVG